MTRRNHTESFMALGSPVSSPVTLSIYLDVTSLAIAKNLRVLKSFLTANTGLESRLYSMTSFYKYTSKGILRKLLLVSPANELRKATLNSLCLSVRVALRTRQLYSHGTDICNFNELFSGSVQRGEFLDKLRTD
jgi:hypothetical protein